MNRLPLPPELIHPSTTIPVLMAMRQFARESLDAWRINPEAYAFTQERAKALDASPELNHLFGLVMKDDYNVHLLLPTDGGAKVYEYDLANLRHGKASYPLGMQPDVVGFKLAINLMMLTMHEEEATPAAYQASVIAAGLELGITKKEFDSIRNPSFITSGHTLRKLEIAARQKHMLQKGWSLNLSLIERRALSTKSFAAGVTDDDIAINETLSQIDTLAHDEGYGKVPNRHVLTGDHLTQHVEFYVCATRSGADVGGVGNVFSLMGDSIQVHSSAPEMVLDGMTGQLLEEVIDHPLFIGSGIRILEAKPDVTRSSFFITHDAEKTNREVPINNANALKIWGRDFDEY